MSEQTLARIRQNMVDNPDFCCRVGVVGPRARYVPVTRSPHTVTRSRRDVSPGTAGFQSIRIRLRFLGLLRHASGFSPALRRIEQEFEPIRYDAQEQRVRSLFDAGKARSGLSPEEARRILWMSTSGDVYRMLVHEAGWTPNRYETWLSTTLLEALVDARAR